MTNVRFQVKNVIPLFVICLASTLGVSSPSFSEAYADGKNKKWKISKVHKGHMPRTIRIQDFETFDVDCPEEFAPIGGGSQVSNCSTEDGQRCMPIIHESHPHDSPNGWRVTYANLGKSTIKLAVRPFAICAK